MRAVHGVRERLRSPDRVVALSDGVYAIVLTILVLELKVPADLSQASLREAIEELRPTMVAWIVSFLFAGMNWVVHRDLFSRVRFVNNDLVWLNLLALLPVSLIPFAASVLGEYPDVPIALRFYGAVTITGSVMRLALYSYVVRHPRLLWAGETSETPRLEHLIVAFPIIVYGVAVAVAAATPTLSVILFFSVPILYFLLAAVLHRREEDEADDLS